jgi:hypothetical protein
MDIVFDIECYPNYFLIMFMNIRDERIKYFEMHNDKWNQEGLREFIHKPRRTFIGFNSLNYDLPVLAAALKRNATNQSIKAVSDAIIVDRVRHWQMDLKLPPIDHIDLMEPAPSVNTGLKAYGGRMHSQKLQDLPLPPDSIIDDATDLRNYCINDLLLTRDLYESIKPRIELREQLGGKSYRSKSDAQMAEAMFKEKLNRLGIETEKQTAPKKLKYSPPDWISFDDIELDDMLDLIKSTEYGIHPTKGHPVAPDTIEGKILLDRFKFGMGGLHSQEKKQTVISSDNELLFDIDFASFYPHIILREGFYPKHLTNQFLDMYGDLMADRLKAKKEGNEVVNQGYKIAINGSFGKLGSKYSFLYSPDLLLHVTLTGQLILLMLIEKIEQSGGRVVSANTDGVVVWCHKSAYEAVKDAYLEIEMLSGIELEESRYKALYSQSVNCYVAVKHDGTCKGKGAYGKPGLTKTPDYEICAMAVKDYITKGIPLHETIHNNRDIRNFVKIRKVKGTAMYQGELIGKLIRFYHSGTEAIYDATSGNKVATSDGCKPLMELPDEFPNDIDYAWYVRQAGKMLKGLGL